jgi:hypothetical protein
MKNLTTAFLTIAILALLALGCSQADEKSSNNSNNGNSNDNKNTSTSSSPTPEPSKEKDNDVAGNYSVTGKNMTGQSYDGDLTIRKQDEVYQFSWSVGGSSYDGVGVRDGNLIAVGYGAGENGKGCGAAIYKRTGDKTLEGKLGGWGINKVGTQTAILLKESKEGGVFSVIGTDTDGSGYKGELFVADSKTDVYHFAFAENGKAKYIGTGIKVGDYFGAGMGVKQCGYVVYDIKSDRLEAAWGVIGNDKLGTEIAKRK